MLKYRDSEFFKRDPVRPEAEYRYRDKLSGKERWFTPEGRAVVASFRPDIGADVLLFASLRDAIPVNRERVMQNGFAVLRVPSDEDVHSTAEWLRSSEAIQNTIPVLQDAEGRARYFLPDELTVQFGPRVRRVEARRIIGEMGSRILIEHKTPGYYTVTVPAGSGLFEAVRRFSELPRVAFAEPSEIALDDSLEAAAVATDFGEQPNLDVISAGEAWIIEKGSSEVVIAVIDTAIDLKHSNLAPNLVLNGSKDWNFTFAGDPPPADLSHGTNVAGIAAARGPEVFGVAPECKIMPLRVAVAESRLVGRVEALTFVARRAQEDKHRRYVVNCSWRISGDNSGIHNAIIEMTKAGVVVICAAGNAPTPTGGADVEYPALYPEVLAVAATDGDDVKAGISCFGLQVTVCAPGVDIFTTAKAGTFAHRDGTSMAAPHVAGLAALILSRNPSLTNEDVRNLVVSTCDSISVKNPGFNGLLGSGRINAGAALKATQ